MLNMKEHTERFTGRVEDYERYRLRYPAAVIEMLVARCGLRREHMIADVGAGTGMLAELFLEHGNAVVAIEPNDDMRAACERLASLWPGLSAVKATAEATGLGRCLDGLRYGGARVSLVRSGANEEGVSADSATGRLGGAGEQRPSAGWVAGVGRL